VRRAPAPAHHAPAPQLFFLLAIYGYILFKASKYIADGSELLTLVLNPGLVGGLVLPVMGAVPDGAIVLFSGLGPNAQAQLNVGVGTLAGSTIMLLTIPWAASVWLGRVDLTDDGSKALYKQRPKLTRPGSDVVHTGVQPSGDIPRSAYIMLATGATYLVVQGPSWAKDAPGTDRAFALAGLLLAVAAFVGYSAYCLLSASSLEAQKAKATAVRKRALADHLVGFTTMLRIEEALAAEALGDRADALVDGAGGDGSDVGGGGSARSLLIGASPDKGGASTPGGGARASARHSTHGGAGSATVAALYKLFDKYDADGSGSIDLSELKLMLRDLGLPVRGGRRWWWDGARGAAAEVERSGCGGRLASLHSPHRRSAPLRLPLPRVSCTPPQRMSGEELKSLMRDVGGEDMAIQFNEFEEVRAPALGSAWGRNGERNVLMGVQFFSRACRAVARLQDLFLPLLQLVARCAQQGEAARASRALFTGVSGGGKDRRGSRASVTLSQAGSDESDEEEDDEEEEDDANNMTPGQIKAKALFLLVAGVGLVTFFRCAPREGTRGGDGEPVPTPQAFLTAHRHGIVVGTPPTFIPLAATPWWTCCRSWATARASSRSTCRL
jgi:Ca2+/Na+ antiporter